MRSLQIYFLAKPAKLAKLSFRLKNATHYGVGFLRMTEDCVPVTLRSVHGRWISMNNRKAKKSLALTTITLRTAAADRAGRLSGLDELTVDLISRKAR